MIILVKLVGKSSIYNGTFSYYIKCNFYCSFVKLGFVNKSRATHKTEKLII